VSEWGTPLCDMDVDHWRADGRWGCREPESLAVQGQLGCAKSMAEYVQEDMVVLEEWPWRACQSPMRALCAWRTASGSMNRLYQRDLQ